MGAAASAVGVGQKPVDRIALPHSSTRNQRQYAFCKIVKEIAARSYQGGFEGPIKKPGSVVGIEEFGPRPVVIECAGPAGDYRRGTRREVAWILWAWDWEFLKWKEVARTQAVNWEWTVDLREPAMRCLYPKPQLMDVMKRGREVATEIVESIEKRLAKETEDVRRSALCSLHDQVSGRIADL